MNKILIWSNNTEKSTALVSMMFLSFDETLSDDDARDIVLKLYKGVVLEITSYKKWEIEPVPLYKKIIPQNILEEDSGNLIYHNKNTIEWLIKNWEAHSNFGFIQSYFINNIKIQTKNL